MPPRGGLEERPVPKEKLGRAPDTELSARDLSCSDQLKTCWSERDEYALDGLLEYDALFACDGEMGDRVARWHASVLGCSRQTALIHE